MNSRYFHKTYHFSLLLQQSPGCVFIRESSFLFLSNSKLFPSVIAAVTSLTGALQAQTGPCQVTVVHVPYTLTNVLWHTVWAKAHRHPGEQEKALIPYENVHVSPMSPDPTAWLLIILLCSFIILLSFTS